MDIDNQHSISAIMEYVNSANLKGSMEIKGNSIWWHLDDVILEFSIDSLETTVLYYCRKNKPHYIGHFHEEHSDTIPLIQDINREDKAVMITATLLGGSSFKLIDKATKRKKSRFFIRRYYSC